MEYFLSNLSIYILSMEFYIPFFAKSLLASISAVFIQTKPDFLQLTVEHASMNLRHYRRTLKVDPCGR